MFNRYNGTKRLNPTSFLRENKALGTISFTLCFAAWGLISAFAPQFRKLFELTPTQSAVLVATPVILGSIARIPVGMVTDRLGGRLVFSALMAVCAVPAFLVPIAASFVQLVVVGFFLGLAGSSFAVGVGFVSRWTPPTKQGGVLGVYGLGNIGQSAAVFFGPLIGASFGWQSVYRGMAVLLVIWGITFGLLARNPPQAKRPVCAGLYLFVRRIDAEARAGQKKEEISML